MKGHVKSKAKIENICQHFLKCTIMGASKEGMEIYQGIVKNGFTSDTMVVNA